MRVPGIFPSGGPADARTRFAALTRSDTGRAAGLAVAMIATNVIALVFTIVFARVLGASGYGSLAALVSAFIILMVPGSALQIASAREVSRARGGGSADAGAGVSALARPARAGHAARGRGRVPLRAVIAAIVNVDEQWAAAAVPVDGMLWVILCVERGALQGFERYRSSR